jgi:hypothetical protein
MNAPGLEPIRTTDQVSCKAPAGTDVGVAL